MCDYVVQNGFLLYAMMAETTEWRSLWLATANLIGCRMCWRRQSISISRSICNQYREDSGFRTQIIQFGPSGVGALIKLIDGLMVATQIVALTERLNLAEQGGLDMAQVVPFLIGAGPGSPVVMGKAARIAAHDYADTQFALRWMHKGHLRAARR